jgi:hypothetical protein
VVSKPMEKNITSLSGFFLCKIYGLIYLFCVIETP